MLEISKKAYVPLARIKEYANVEPERVLELAKDRRVRYFNVNGHFFVCLNDVKREKELRAYV